METGNRKTGFILVTDVGSTNTKALLLKRDTGGRLEIAAGTEVPSTTGAPWNDACIGVGKSIITLESIVGEILSRGMNMPSVPYFSAGSAGKPGDHDDIGPGTAGEIHVPAVRIYHNGNETAARELDDFVEKLGGNFNGFSELQAFALSEILPTPSALSNILRLYCTRSGERAAMIDMGGTYTGIFSGTGNDFHATLLRGIGTGRSMGGILARCGIRNIMAHLPEHYTEEDVKEYAEKKVRFPESIPFGRGETLVERTMAMLGASLALREHASLHHAEKIPSTDIDTLIGSGGVFAHAGRKAAFRMLAESSGLGGVIRLAVDTKSLAPHLGTLSEIDGDEAYRLFSEKCLENLGWVVAPSGGFERGIPAILVRNRDTGLDVEVPGGEVSFFDSGGDLEFIPYGDASLGEHPGHLTTDLPVLVDCRGAPDTRQATPLRDFGIPWFRHENLTGKGRSR